jgi:hypothetical protein
MEKLFKQMMEEKHDFYKYMDLEEECHDTAIRTKLHAIAGQEAQHFKDLYDIVFKEDPTHPWTHMEKWFAHEAKEWFDEMMEAWKSSK